MTCADASERSSDLLRLLHYVRKRCVHLRLRTFVFSLLSVQVGATLDFTGFQYSQAALPHRTGHHPDSWHNALYCQLTSP